MEFPLTKPKTVSHDFMQRGNCLGMNPDDFFPERGDYKRLNAAKAICAACEVQSECLEYALDNPIERFGIWGGTSEKERRPLRVARTMALKNRLTA